MVRMLLMRLPGLIPEGSAPAVSRVSLVKAGEQFEPAERPSWSITWLLYLRRDGGVRVGHGGSV